MKFSNALLAVTVVALAAALPAFAQMPTYKADIPFQFVVGDRSMPAGQYSIVVVPVTNRIEMTAPDGVTTLFFPGRTGGSTSQPGTLTFARSGGHGFLRSIDVGGRNTYLPKTKAEREAAQVSAVSASTELALLRVPVR